MTAHPIWHYDKSDIDQLIVPPGLGTRSEVLDAMALAIAAE